MSAAEPTRDLAWAVRRATLRGNMWSAVPTEQMSDDDAMLRLLVAAAEDAGRLDALAALALKRDWVELSCAEGDWFVDATTHDGATTNVIGRGDTIRAAIDAARAAGAGEER